MDHGGTGQVFMASPLDEAAQTTLMELFRVDRSQEYAEFREQCQGFLAEIKKETRRANLSFAEWEENEHNLERLYNWLHKIQERDFFPGHATKTAQAELETCRRALAEFDRLVYIQEGIDSGDDHGQP